MQLKVPLPFLTTIVVPIVGNAAEHSSAILFAMKNRMEIALGVAVGEAAAVVVAGVGSEGAHARATGNQQAATAGGEREAGGGRGGDGRQRARATPGAKTRVSVTKILHARSLALPLQPPNGSALCSHICLCDQHAPPALRLT